MIRPVTFPLLRIVQYTVAEDQYQLFRIFFFALLLFVVGGKPTCSSHSGPRSTAAAVVSLPLLELANNQS